MKIVLSCFLVNVSILISSALFIVYVPHLYVRIYLTRLFERTPDAQQLFDKLMKNDDGQHVLDTPKMKKHISGVMKMINVAVSKLNEPEVLTTAVQALGTKHARYGVTPDLLPLLWPAVRDVMVQELTDVFTPQADQAWTHFFDFVNFNMTIGMEMAM